MKKKVQTIVTSKSQQIITMWLDKVAIKDIHKSLNIRYQFANNVVHRYCKKHNLQFDTYNDATESKKSLIIPLYFDEKKSIKEVATLLKTNKSYVWQVVDEHRQSL